MEAKYRLAELMGLYMNLDSVSEPESIHAPGDTAAAHFAPEISPNASLSSQRCIDQ
jgi:hypothetical protein